MSACPWMNASAAKYIGLRTWRSANALEGEPREAIDQDRSAHALSDGAFPLHLVIS